MTYVTSDLHGYPLEKIKSKLDEIGFGSGDRLYILGDCIDRGHDGLRILRWVMSQPNITLLIGNHEAMLLENHFLFERDTIPVVTELCGKQRHAYEMWTSNGGYLTIDAMQQLNPAQTKYLLQFLADAPLYEEVEVNGTRYILTHSGLGSFDAEKPLADYTPAELLWTRPTPDTRYYEDGRMVVFGHTPTVMYGVDYAGIPVFTDTWIAIDTGAGVGLRPALLRLEDMQVSFF